jgi:spermidine synthase
MRSNLASFDYANGNQKIANEVQNFLATISAVHMIWFFAFFAVSGFCSILYELVWLRLAMAQFGVTTPLVSIVLSMFMAGLGLGSRLAGAFARRLEPRPSFNPLRLYALCELLIAASALLVPSQFSLGHRLLVRLSDQSGISSTTYYLTATLWLALTLIPWCVCMGATIPLVMAAIRRGYQGEGSRAFSFLYLANLAGAVAGALVPLLLVELLGFRETLRIGACMNVAIAACAFLLSFFSGRIFVTKTEMAQPSSPPHTGPKASLVLLFVTGLATMGMEVVWLRLFTPSVGPLVYSFALILACYLFSTFLGSRTYRAWSRAHANVSTKSLWLVLPVLGLLPLLTTDFRLQIEPWLRVFLGVMPFCAVIGFVTPMLVDRWSSGDPGRAGKAYAWNVLGCILGPIISGFLLLPRLGERVSLLLFALAFFAVAAFVTSERAPRLIGRFLPYATVTATAVIFLVTDAYESRFPGSIVFRDSTATVIGTTERSTGKRALLVNGIGMTELTLATKMMAHLTLASHQRHPQNTLVICFGMGTTFRSALSWGVPTTVVDLVPSVPKLFPYFHHDAAQVVASPLARIVVDDGRRYLERSTETFDSIIIDPPPPVPAAGSSLLYSVEFYDLAKRHLRNGGILQQWLPMGDRSTQVAVFKALQFSFPYVRVFQYRGSIGWHYLASMQPIPARAPNELAATMPAAAVADLVEWEPTATPDSQFGRLPEIPQAYVLHLAPEVQALDDDRPVNEYYFLRTPCLTCVPAIEWSRQRINSALSRALGPKVAVALR